MMRVCAKCRNVKFWFQFTSEFLGLYTGVYEVCKKCTKRMGIDAARDYVTKEGRS